MGHANDYQEAIDWHPGLTLQQREHRAPFQAAFAAGKADLAKEAVEQAQRQADAGAWVLTLVEEQAVWACLADGMTVRATAEKLSMTKSHVGRIAKRLTRGSGGGPESRVIFPAGLNHLSSDVRSRVRACWNGPGNAGQ